ncbi:hypothetical protein [Brevibacillus brevis]|nr:hypothetical protein [Brevibacillus brevis]
MKLVEIAHLTLSVEVLAEAVVNAILSAKGAGGVPAYQDLH